MFKFSTSSKIWEKFIQKLNEWDRSLKLDLCNKNNLQIN